MSQFDFRTEQLSGKYSARFSRQSDFKNGRNSAKESLTILARAVEEASDADSGDGVDEFAKVIRSARNAIAEVKARGDWVLEDK